MKKFWIMGCMLAALMAGCDKTDDLKEDINDLTARVDALERWKVDLDKNVESVKNLVAKNLFVTNIEQNKAEHKVILSFSDGSTVELAEAGNAAGAGATQIADVKKEGGYLVFTLNSEILKVPVIKDFFCYFDKSIQGLQVIKKGESKDFVLHIKGNAGTPSVFAPAGWKVVIGEIANELATVKVTAPESEGPATRAVADNTTDISVMAVSDNNLVAIAKIAVSTSADGAAEGPDAPNPGDAVTPAADVVNIPAAAFATATDAGKFSTAVNSNNVAAMTAGGWYFRNVNGIAVNKYDKAEQAVSIQLTGSGKGTWNNTSIGYHIQQQFDTASNYKLTFKVKGDVDGSVGICVRTADDQKGLLMLKPDMESNDRNVTTPAVKTEWTEVIQNFSFAKGSVKSTSTANTYKQGEADITAEELKSLNVLFYNNKAGSTIYIKDIKLEKIK